MYHCSLVCKHWVDSCLSRLYRHLRISSRDRFHALARSGDFVRCTTISMSLLYGPDKDELEKVKMLATGCVGLKELVWADTIDGDVATMLLSCPELASLEKLTLQGYVVGRTNQRATFSCRLKSLRTDLDNHSFDTLCSLVSASNNGSCPSLTLIDLTPFDLSRYPAFRLREEFHCVSAFYDAAPGLKTILLPAMDDVAETFDQNSFNLCLLQLLRLCHQLSHLTLSTDSASDPDNISLTLTCLFDSLDHSLESFTFVRCAEFLSPNGFKVLQMALEPLGKLSLLKVLEVPSASLVELEGVKGWSELAAVLAVNEVEVFTRER